MCISFSNIVNWSSNSYCFSLAAVIMLGGGISGGHFNPAVSVMMAVKGKLKC